MTAAIREHAGKNGKDTICAFAKHVCHFFALAFEQQRHARVVLEFAWCRRCPSGSKRSKTGHLAIGNVVSTHGRSADSNVICGHLKSFVLLRRCLELLYGGKEGGMLDILR